MGLRPTQKNENPWVFDRAVAVAGRDAGAGLAGAGFGCYTENTSQRTFYLFLRWEEFTD